MRITDGKRVTLGATAGHAYSRRWVAAEDNHCDLV